jgi:hypothetical protein
MMVLVAEPFYQHDSLGPGAPLTEITGPGEGAGFYDWAGRRLFLADGEPDPMCPGAYRYQHNPSSCDLDAPDSDPRSPRYEPMHLRHKPGDTWIIDSNRPHDPFDPGPFGSPGWYPDRRTGRHRRDETPDPLPADGWVRPEKAWYPGVEDRESEPSEPEPPQPVPPWRNREDRPRTGDGGSGRGPTPPRTWRPDPLAGDQPPEPNRRGRDRFWGTANQDQPPGEFQFSRMREAAFDRFMANSAALHAAHLAPETPYLRERLTWVLRWCLWVAACGLVPMPRPLVGVNRAAAASRPSPGPLVPQQRSVPALSAARYFTGVARGREATAWQVAR